ncbi:hypothetical protein NL676_031567 [Syzygium grande]|nr:hypothetical protein NL676_031567 [Syzygium grande]
MQSRLLLLLPPVARDRRFRAAEGLGEGAARERTDRRTARAATARLGRTGERLSMDEEVKGTAIRSNADRAI